MRIAVVTLAFVLMGGAIAAAAVPLPRPRPVAAKSAPLLPPARPLPSGSFQPFAPASQPTIPPSRPGDAPKTAEAAPRPSACQLALKAVALFAPESAIDGPGNCGIADPVRLEAVILPDRTHVAIHPPAMLRCKMAAAVAHWIRNDIAPAAGRLGSALRGIVNFDSYSCRGRNRVFGARMSEHGRGNAFDIRGMRLASGTVAHLTDPLVAKAVRDDLRKSACARFTTVLGPSSDGYHENHIHVDLAARRSGYRLCQWEVLQPPDPTAPPPHVVSSRVPLPPKRQSAARQSPP